MNCTFKPNDKYMYLNNNNNNGVFLYSAYTMLCALHTLPLVTGPVQSCTISTPFLDHTTLAAISALGTNRTHCHLCSTRYSFTPESSEAFEGKVPCPRTQHRNNVPILNTEDPAPSRIRNRTAGSDISKAPRSSHYATSLSIYRNRKTLV